MSVVKRLIASQIKVFVYIICVCRVYNITLYIYHLYINTCIKCINVYFVYIYIYIKYIHEYIFKTILVIK